MRFLLYFCSFLFLFAGAAATPYLGETPDRHAASLAKKCLIFVQSPNKELENFSVFKKRLLPINRFSEVPDRFEHLKEYDFYTSYVVWNSLQSRPHIISLGVSEVVLPSNLLRQCHVSYEEENIGFNPINYILPESKLIETKVEKFFTPRNSQRKITRRKLCGGNNDISITEATVRAVKGTDLQQTGQVVKNYPEEGALQPPIRHILITNSSCDTPTE